MKKRQRKVRLIRAAIQLVFFIFYPALFSTAFAGIKSVFQALAAHQPITWNSFLDVTGVLLVITILFGRHFCGYACAFGSVGDAMYELTLFIRQKIFHQERPPWLSGKSSESTSESKIHSSGFFAVVDIDRMVCKSSGHESVGCFFHADRRKTSECFL